MTNHTVNGQIDWHRGVRTLISEAAKEARKKQAKELAKMSCMTDFMRCTDGAPKSLLREDQKLIQKKLKRCILIE